MKRETDDQKSNQHNYNKISLGLAIGLASGVAIGVAMNSLALGIAVGVSLGTTMGVALSERPDLSKEDSRWLMIGLITLGLLMFISIVVYVLVSNR